MIKATIAGESFVLQSLKDAEQLLQILERAKPVASGYLGAGSGYLGAGSGYREVLYSPEPARRFECTVTICADSAVITHSEFLSLRAADEASAAAATAAAAPAGA